MRTGAWAWTAALATNDADLLRALQGTVRAEPHSSPSLPVAAEPGRVPRAAPEPIVGTVQEVLEATTSAKSAEPAPMSAPTSPGRKTHARLRQEATPTTAAATAALPPSRTDASLNSSRNVPTTTRPLTMTVTVPSVPAQRRWRPTGLASYRVFSGDDITAAHSTAAPSTAALSTPVPVTATPNAAVPVTAEATATAPIAAHAAPAAPNGPVASTDGRHGDLPLPAPTLAGPPVQVDVDDRHVPRSIKGPPKLAFKAAAAHSASNGDASFQ